MSMLQAHMDAIENNLVALSQIPANAGHTLHRGTPREIFIKTYLEGHIGANVAIGTGEIIDALSQPRELRHQYDIVVYKKNYPKLDFGGGISGFLIESVIATIEVKSLLDQDGINQAVGAAHKAKSLVSNIIRPFAAGWMPPKVLNYVVAYVGPAQMQTVHGWIVNAHNSMRIPMPNWAPQDNDVPGTALDGVFVLKKGFVVLGNTPVTLNWEGRPGRHIVVNSVNGNILEFFLLLQTACSNLDAGMINPIPYLQGVVYPEQEMM